MDLGFHFPPAVSNPNVCVQCTLNEFNRRACKSVTRSDVVFVVDCFRRQWWHTDRITKLLVRDEGKAHKWLSIEPHKVEQGKKTQNNRIYDWPIAHTLHIHESVIRSSICIAKNCTTKTRCDTRARPHFEYSVLCQTTLYLCTAAMCWCVCVCVRDIIFVV